MLSAPGARPRNLLFVHSSIAPVQKQDAIVFSGIDAIVLLHFSLYSGIDVAFGNIAQLASPDRHGYGPVR